jgi:8-oxo-dGTP diphosphatase
MPGGFVEYGERVENAAVREAREETGLEVTLGRLVGVYSEPGRDPRGHVVGICFLAKPVGGKLVAASDAAEVGVFRKIPWKELAFDHAKILKDAGLR